jgi:tRNA pseudouridine55 synthase
MPAPGIAPATPNLRRAVDGLLLLDKPIGITSNAALARVKRLYRAEKAGHTGTLDPLASGLLPICLGIATRFAQFLLDAHKRYVATVRFGITTTTQDGEGDVVEERPVTFDRERLLATLPGFVGRLTQTPPAHAALKFEGRPYYDYARRGVDIPRAPRAIEIASLELLEWCSPDASIDVECSKGTYVRVVAADLGAALGTGAHLHALRRTRTGGFDLRDAVTFAELEAMDDTARLARLLPIDAPLARVPRLDLAAAVARDLMQGRFPAIEAEDGCYRAYGPNGAFLGVAQATGAQLHALRMVPAAVATSGVSHVTATVAD